MKVIFSKEIKQRELLLALPFFVIAAFCLFANTFGNVWTYDDFPVILENPDIRSIGAFFENAYPGRPLREITYLLDHTLFGLEPAGWHIQNIFWHGLNAFLVFALVLRLGGGRCVAWCSSLLFLVHPIQVEVVANISHRKDSLALAFSLLSVLAYTEALVARHRRAAWTACALGLAFVAYLAKQNVVVLPLIAVAYELTVPEERRFLLKSQRVWRAMLLAGAFLGGAWFWSGGKVETLYQLIRGLAYKSGQPEGGMLDVYYNMLAYKANYFGEVTSEVFFRMVFKSWAFMLSKFYYPVGLALEYTYPVPSSWLDPWVMAAVLGGCLYLYALWLSFRRWPLVFFALIWLGAFWLPVSNLVPLAYFAADRYLYAPSVGLFIATSAILCRTFARPAVVIVALLVVTTLLASLTWRQNRVWRTPETLWTRVYEINPSSSFALNNLGNLHLLKGELLEAKGFYSESVAVNPLNVTAYYNLGLIYERIGDREQALASYRRFLEIDEPSYRAAAQTLRQRLLREYGEEWTFAR